VRRAVHQVQVGADRRWVDQIRGYSTRPQLTAQAVGRGPVVGIRLLVGRRPLTFSQAWSAASRADRADRFLRRLGEAKLIDPYRSGGGHRRYSRYQLRLAARAREMCDHGIDMASAVRIIILEDQLEEALRHYQSQPR